MYMMFKQNFPLRVSHLRKWVRCEVELFPNLQPLLYLDVIDWCAHHLNKDHYTAFNLKLTLYNSNYLILFVQPLDKLFG